MCRRSRVDDELHSQNHRFSSRVGLCPVAAGIVPFLVAGFQEDPDQVPGQFSSGHPPPDTQSSCRHLRLPDAPKRIGNERCSYSCHLVGCNAGSHTGFRDGNPPLDLLSGRTAGPEVPRNLGSHRPQRFAGPKSAISMSQAMSLSASRSFSSNPPWSPAIPIGILSSPRLKCE